MTETEEQPSPCAGCEACPFEPDGDWGRPSPPYELHLSVALARADQWAREAFTTACSQLGVKPILLLLPDASGPFYGEMAMTSSRYVGDDPMGEVERLGALFGKRSFKVTRKKIETVPWHVAAPRAGAGPAVFRPGQYFEFHAQVRISPRDYGLLWESARGVGVHLSRNARREIDQTGLAAWMITARWSDCVAEEARDRMHSINTQLREKGWEPTGSRLEFSLYDSDVHQDARWLSAS